MSGTVPPDHLRSHVVSVFSRARWTDPRPVLRFAPLVLCLLFVGPASAQSGDPGSAFCGSTMAGTIQNLFSIIQFGGPLVGGVLALGATVTIPLVRRSDYKREMKTIRNQGVLYGVIIAPLGTEIVQFILNNVVAGGTSCGF